MPIAAVPAYLGQDFKTASPGLRFGLLLPIWTSRDDQERAVRSRAGGKSREAQEVARSLEREGMDQTIDALCRRDRNRLESVWEKNDAGARQVWSTVTALTPDDVTRMDALVARQAAMAAGSAQCFSLFGLSTAPFTTGLGNEHPLENGFAFLNPYGLPYLPGSGVKGVLRQAARELVSGEWGDPQGWTQEAIRILFGHDDANDAQRGALGFWDVIPRIKGDGLQVDVMTAHQMHYHQQGESPHESGQPNPIAFLTLPPGTAFDFHVTANRALLSRHAPELLADARWQALLTAAFAHAFAWLGFGAKTAVGYGAMAKNAQRHEQQREEAERAAAEREKEEQLAKATAGLPEDAVPLFAWNQDAAWKADNNRVLSDLDGYLDAERNEPLSGVAIELLAKIVEENWPGILNDPRAVKGKKKTPKFKPRPIALAERINALGKGDGPG